MVPGKKKKKKSSVQNTTLIKKQIRFYHWEVTSDNVFSKDGVWGLGIFSCSYSQVVVFDLLLIIHFFNTLGDGDEGSSSLLAGE